MYIYQDAPDPAEDIPDNNEAVPEEEEPKEVSSNHNLGIAHLMFSRVLNFQFLIVFRQRTIVFLIKILPALAFYNLF